MSMSGPTAQRGLALVTVLWVLVLLSVVAASFTLTVQREVNAVRNSIDIKRGHYLAQAGMRYALMQIFHPDQEVRWFPDGNWHRFELDGVPVEVRVSSLAGRIDLNHARPEMLDGLLRVVGVEDEGLRQTLVADIEDWRDGDDATRQSGSGADAYPDEAPGPANRPFFAVEELQQVIGISPTLYRRLAPHLTVYAGSDTVVPHGASREVLLAVPDATDEMVDEFLAQRDEAAAAGRELPAFPVGGGAFEAFGVNGYAVDVWVGLPGGLSVGRGFEAAVRSDGAASDPFVVLSTRDLPR